MISKGFPRGLKNNSEEYKARMQVRQGTGEIFSTFFQNLRVLGEIIVGVLIRFMTIVPNTTEVPLYVWRVP